MTLKQAIPLVLLASLCSPACGDVHGRDVRVTWEYMIVPADAMGIPDADSQEFISMAYFRYPKLLGVNAQLQMYRGTIVGSLNEYGDDGWELVAVDNGEFVFKRSK